MLIIWQTSTTCKIHKNNVPSLNAYIFIQNSRDVTLKYSPKYRNVYAIHLLDYSVLLLAPLWFSPFLLLMITAKEINSLCSS